MSKAKSSSASSLAAGKASAANARRKGGMQIFRIDGSRRSALDMARGRLVIISAAFVIAYGVVAARVVDLSIIQGQLAHFHVTGDEAVTDGTGGAAELLADGADAEAVQDGDGRRADIVDRNGVLLATSLETSSLFVDPKLILSPVSTARKLVKIFPDLSYGDVLQKLQRKSRFVWLKRNITPQEHYKVMEIGEPGLAFQKEYKRIYPQGVLAPHMVGFTNVDGQGLAGVERSFNKLLAAGGDEPLRLTLDMRVQNILREQVMKAVKDFTAKGGAGVVMDVTNGQILAAESYPDFDPHHPSGGRAMFNYLTLGTYEMGSTFKIFSTAALLEFGNEPIGRRFKTTEPIKRGRFTISDYHPEKHDLSIPEIFMWSSNIGAALMGEEVGTDKLKAFFSDLGLMNKLPLEIKEIGRPQIPYPWREINTLTASFGHGIAVAPLQMVMAASSIVNGGILVKPTLVLDTPDDTKAGAARAGDDAAKLSQKNTELRVVSPQTAHRMRQLLRLVVTDGTGSKADVKGYMVGGKTGTAEKSVNGKYDHSKLMSSFIGFFPMDAPRYAVFIMVDEPHGNKESFGFATGGWAAAPYVGRVVQAMAPLMGIAPRDIPEQLDIAAPLRGYIRHDDDKKKGKVLVSYGAD